MHCTALQSCFVYSRTDSETIMLVYKILPNMLAGDRKPEVQITFW